LTTRLDAVRRKNLGWTTVRSYNAVSTRWPLRHFSDKLQRLKAALLYPGSEGNLYSLSDPSVQTKELIRFLHSRSRCFGRGDLSSVWERRSRYNDLAFALPANAEGVYFSQKAAARDAMVGDLSSLWGEN